MLEDNWADTHVALTEASMQNTAFPSFKSADADLNWQ